MVAGLYLLAGPFRDERSSIFRLLPVWAILVFYEFTVIGAVAFLRRRGEDSRALTAVALFFLVDPIFLGDAFASTDPEVAVRLGCGAWVLSILKAGALAHATGFKVSPWQVGWAAAAFGFMHLFPSLIAFPAARPADFSDYFTLGMGVASGLTLPLLRAPRLGWLLAGGAFLHLAASGWVGGVVLEPRHFVAPLLALAVHLPRRRYSPLPLAAAVLCSPLRSGVAKFLSTADGIGIVCVAAAFILLAAGFLRNARLTFRALTTCRPGVG